MVRMLQHHTSCDRIRSLTLKNIARISVPNGPGVILDSKRCKLCSIQGILDARAAPVTQVNLRDAVRVATIDNFQGEESTIVILSLVRNNKYVLTHYDPFSSRVLLERTNTVHTFIFAPQIPLHNLCDAQGCLSPVMISVLSHVQARHHWLPQGAESDQCAPVARSARHVHTRQQCLPLCAKRCRNVASGALQPWLISLAFMASLIPQPILPRSDQVQLSERLGFCSVHQLLSVAVAGHRHAGGR